jgi:hypothetical protein
MYFHTGLLSKSAIRALCLALFAVLGLFAFIWPVGSRQLAADPSTPTVKRLKEGFPNYDIRADKRANEKLRAFRLASKKSAWDVADVRDAFVRGEKRLKARVPALKIEYNNDLRTPEIIAPDVTAGEAVLARASGTSRVDTLRSFLAQNTELVGARAAQINELVSAADYTNPDGVL